jgi:hypothetical protein
MLSSVLRSERAVQVNIEIMRAFVRLRELVATHKDLARKLEALEKRYDAQFKVVFDAIRELMAPEPKKRKIGFLVKERAARYGRAQGPPLSCFRNSGNVEVSCWRCLSKTRMTLILTFREFSKHGSVSQRYGVQWFEETD